MIKPTVGRIVDYWPCGLMLGDSAVAYDGRQPFAAQIAYVWSDSCVNLAATDHAGRQFPVSSVTLWQGEGDRPSYPHCSWSDFEAYMNWVRGGSAAPG